MRTSIVKRGNGQEILLPKLLLESVHLADGEIVDITAENDSIIIKKSDKKRIHRTFEERIANFSGDYVFTEWDTGPPVGNEIW